MTKIIVGIRHARPESFSGSLSEEGKNVQKQMSNRLKQEGITPSKIFHSPLARAVETAEILGEILEAPTAIEPALGELFDIDTLFNHIQAAEENSTLFFVGHQPTLAKFIEMLVGDRILPAGLKKSEAVVIQFNDAVGYGNATLIKRYQPDET